MPILFWLLVGHAVCDFPLQGDFLAKAKNYKTAITGIPWIYALFMHSLIHAGMVAMVTGSLYLAICELVIHIVTDALKCADVFGFKTDQAIHIACKFLYVALMYFSVV